MDIFSKIKLIFQKPKVIVVASSGLEQIREKINQVLSRSPKSGPKVLVTDNPLAGRSLTEGHLVFNFDDENIRKLIEKNSFEILTFGFQEGADLKASDVKINGGINFKINYKGNVVPVWLSSSPAEARNEQIYAVLAAVGVGVIAGLNLVEISQSLTPVIK